MESDTTERNGRLDWIDWIRGLAILFVVFYHATTALIVLGVAAPRWAEYANFVVAPYRMPMLMFLSGTLLTRSLRKPRGEYIEGKLTRIGWPYIVWTTVIVAFLILASQVVGNGNYSVASIPEILLDPATYTWYLAYLLLYYLIALVTPAIVRAAAIPVLFAIAFIVDDGDGWSRLTFLLAFFFLGDLAARHPRVWSTLASRPYWLAAAALLLGGTIWLTLHGNGARYAAGTLLGVVAILVLARATAQSVARLPVLSSLTAVGRDSIIYYTVHWVFIAAGAHVLAKIGVHSGNLALALLLTIGLFVPWLFVLGARRWPAVHALFVFPRPTRIPEHGSIVRTAVSGERRDPRFGSGESA